MNINVLIGKTLTAIRKTNSHDGDGDRDEVEFVTRDDERYIMNHRQDCCERVWVEDICGDLDDIIGLPILLAQESTSENPPDDNDKNYYHYGSETWTFYKLATVQGSVTIRWCGTSNGYYSEAVSFDKVG